MTDQAQSRRARLSEILRVFARIGAMSYGGAAIMGITQVEVQQRRGWLTKERYLEGMALVNMWATSSAGSQVLPSARSRSSCRR